MIVWGISISDVPVFGGKSLIHVTIFYELYGHVAGIIFKLENASRHVCLFLGHSDISLYFEKKIPMLSWGSGPLL